MYTRTLAVNAVLMATVVTLAACSGQGGSSSPPAATDKSVWNSAAVEAADQLPDNADGHGLPTIKIDGVDVLSGVQLESVQAQCSEGSGRPVSITWVGWSASWNPEVDGLIEFGASFSVDPDGTGGGLVHYKGKNYSSNSAAGPAPGPASKDGDWYTVSVQAKEDLGAFHEVEVRLECANYGGPGG